MSTTTTVTVTFADETHFPVPARLVPDVLGLDADGDLVITSEIGPILLTSCCYATGKGSTNSATGVCCRACYVDVEEKFGGAGVVVTPVCA